MLAKICVSIAEKTYADIMNSIMAYSFAEIRLDLSDISEAEIQAIFSNSNKCLIATCRRGKYNESERIKRLTVAMEAGAAYVDIEFEESEQYQQHLFKIARKQGCKLIISHHYYTTTPDTQELDNIVTNCKKLNADVVKLVSTAHSPIDCARVLSLYSKHENMIAFAMGEHGKISRLTCLYLGAPFTYASLNDNQAVASGQLSVSTLQELIKLI